MAFEAMTYDSILQRMIDRVVSAYPNVDVRNGSIIQNALAPAAAELSMAYVALNNVLNESFADTATRWYLLKKCEEVGMDTARFEATYGTFKGSFNVEIELGSRWNCDIHNYSVTEYLGVEDGKHTYKLTCETVGSSPNDLRGTLTPITYFPTGMTYAELVGVITEGENEVEDETIRQKYFEYLKASASDGNIGQYEQWCSDYDGIGNYKIFPLWNGANTVKVSILSASNLAASPELVAEFQNYLDPNSNGMGDGVAPIGAIVTVTTATQVPITVTAAIKMREGYSDTTPISDAIDAYIAELAYKRSVVPYMSVGAVILSAEGVDSISNLLVNGGTKDITLGAEEIPVKVSAGWTVTSV